MAAQGNSKVGHFFSNFTLEKGDADRFIVDKSGYTVYRDACVVPGRLRTTKCVVVAASGVAAEMFCAPGCDNMLIAFVRVGDNIIGSLNPEMFDPNWDSSTCIAL